MWNIYRYLNIPFMEVLPFKCYLKLKAQVYSSKVGLIPWLLNKINLISALGLQAATDSTFQVGEELFPGLRGQCMKR